MPASRPIKLGLVPKTRALPQPMKIGFLNQSDAKVCGFRLTFAFFPLFPRLRGRDWSVTLFARDLIGYDLISLDCVGSITV